MRLLTRTGALGRRGFALESAAARVCREAGGRVTTNVMVRDLDLPVLNATNSRRLEVVVDGLPLFGGSQLAVDTTLVCSLHSDGSPHRGAADTDGVVFLPGGAKNCGTQSWWVQAVVRILSCWPWRSAAGGHQRRAPLLLSWRRRKPDGSQPSCRRRRST